jgi:hypothetical protein
MKMITGSGILWPTRSIQRLNDCPPPPSLLLITTPGWHSFSVAGRQYTYWPACNPPNASLRHS